MDINSLSPLSSSNIMKVNTTAEKDNNITSSFGDYLNNAISQVNDLQQQSVVSGEKLATGEADDLHQVMIATEKADLAFQLTVQIRNKVLDAYQEIMRMQF